jgi:hypothetical protein
MIGKYMTRIIECTRCRAPQVFTREAMDSDVPVALEVNLDGGYMMFVDNIYMDDSLNMMLCHKCAHEFVDWLGIPAKTVTRWHPKTDDPYCHGWTIEEAING